MTPKKYESVASHEQEPRLKTSIRPAAIEDVDFIFSLDEQARIASIGQGYSPERMHEVKTDITEKLVNPRYATEIIMCENTPAGMVMSDNEPDPIDPSNIVIPKDGTIAMTTEDVADLLSDKAGVSNRKHILSLALDEKYRNQGIGKTAMQELLAAIDPQESITITFDTGRNNVPMQKLAKYFGFTLVGLNEESDDAYGGEKIIGVWHRPSIAELQRQQETRNQSEEAEIDTLRQSLDEI
ncbi:GNAT family N-acetyltransferase [candidate division WWE3 bacterium]|nr:GNAT family N-acetyltransferase [candidate division WWE3 bacterium]